LVGAAQDRPDQDHPLRDARRADDRRRRRHPGGREEDGRARPSHQIQQCLFGPDGKLYTFVADGTGPRQAASDATYNGKVLRLNPDGTAPTDNPRYDPANPTAPISYSTKGQACLWPGLPQPTVSSI
jgi:hypothetical protein